MHFTESNFVEEQRDGSLQRGVKYSSAKLTCTVGKFSRDAVSSVFPCVSTSASVFTRCRTSLVCSMDIAYSRWSVARPTASSHVKLESKRLESVRDVWRLEVVSHHSHHSKYRQVYTTTPPSALPPVSFDHPFSFPFRSRPLCIAPWGAEPGRQTIFGAFKWKFEHSLQFNLKFFFLFCTLGRT